MLRARAAAQGLGPAVFTIFVGASLAACGGSGGVHAVVGIDVNAFDPSLLFDHVAVRATGANKSATACLFANGPALEVGSADRSADPCADLVPPLGTDLPDASAWALTPLPRSINFVFEAGDVVTVSAFAAFGRSASVGSATNASAVAGGAYPSLNLTLEPGNSPLPVGCGLMFVPPATGDNSMLCKSPEDGCPLEASHENHGPNMTCVADFSRVSSLFSPSCPGQDPGSFAAWESDSTDAPPTGCVGARITGRFAACASGSTDAACALTSNCVAPTTSVILYNSALDPQVTDITCLPPSTVPLTFVIPFDNQHRRLTGETATNTVALASSSADAQGGTPCFFDVVSVGLTGCPNGSP